MTHPDQKYVEALLNNDRVLLEEIYQNYSGKIKWMVLQNRGTEDDAADIFQDALLSILHKARNQDFKLTCPLDAFLYMICKNKWLNELSKRKINVRLLEISNHEDILSEDSFKLAEDCASEDELLNLILEKFAELGESCQRLLSLSWGGRPMEEVAEILGVTYGYARKKKSECMARLIMLVHKSPKFKSLKENGH